MVKTANEIFRDFETDGVPSSGLHQPIKADIRAWGSLIENTNPSVFFYPSIAGIGTVEIPTGVHRIHVDGRNSAGDGEDGLYLDTDTGSLDTFVTADGRTWYRAATVADNALPRSGGDVSGPIYFSPGSFVGFDDPSSQLAFGINIDGSNNFGINRHNSSGTYIDSPIKIQRSDGAIIHGGGRLRPSNWFLNDVRESGAETFHSAADNLTSFNVAAALPAPEVHVPAGTFPVNESIALGSKNWFLDKGAKVTDAGGGVHDASYLGAGAGEFLTPHPIDNTNRLISDHGMLHVLNETMSLTQQPGGLSYNHSNQVYRYVDSQVGTGVGDTSYFVTGAAYWCYSPVGSIAKAEGRRQSGSTDLFGGLLFMSTATGDATKPGRSEMTPISIGAYCAHDWVGAANGQQKINIYMDWNMSGPSNEEERFMSGHNVFMRKFHPGDTYDADHNGSFGISIATAPGNDGFGVPATEGLRTSPLRAGVAVSGFSGKISEGATWGGASASDIGFKYGVLVGGSNNVYLDGQATAISKIGIAFAGRDYTVAGLQLFSAHPQATNPLAIDAAASAGRFRLGADSMGVEYLGVGNGSSQFASNMVLYESGHATSKRASISLNNQWTMLQDSSGNGVEDLAFYHAATGRSPISISVADKVTLWSLVIGQQYTPGASSDSSGVFGEIITDDNYIYVKRTTGWKRVAISAF